MTENSKVPIALAAIDEQIELERHDVEEAQERIDKDKKVIADAIANIDALTRVREPLAALIERFTGTTTPPPAIPDISPKPKPAAATNGGAVFKPRKPRKTVKPEQIVDAIRALGGRATVADVAHNLDVTATAVRSKMERLVSEERLEFTAPEKRGLPGYYSIPAPKPGSPDVDEAADPPHHTDGEHANDVREPVNGHDTVPPEMRCEQCGVKYAEHPAGDGVDECPGDFGPEPAERLTAAMAAGAIAAASIDLRDDEADDIKPVEVAAIEAAGIDTATVRRTSPNLSRLPKREAPPLSSRTRRAMAATRTAEPREEQSVDGRLLLIFQGGARDARWKVGELIREYSHRWRGRALTSDEVGRALSTLVARNLVHAESDWFSLEIGVSA
jgi:hypothetical protein